MTTTRTRRLNADAAEASERFGDDGLERYASAREDVLRHLDEARTHLKDAIDPLEEAARLSRDTHGPAFVAGQLEMYTIPWVGRFIDDRTQPGSIAHLLSLLDADPMTRAVDRGGGTR